MSPEDQDLFNKFKAWQQAEADAENNTFHNNIHKIQPKPTPPKIELPMTWLPIAVIIGLCIFLSALDLLVIGGAIGAGITYILMTSRGNKP